MREGSLFRLYLNLGKSRHVRQWIKIHEYPDLLTGLELLT